MKVRLGYGEVVEALEYWLKHVKLRKEGVVTNLKNVSTGGYNAAGLEFDVDPPSEDGEE